MTEQWLKKQGHVQAHAMTHVSISFLTAPSLFYLAREEKHMLFGVRIGAFSVVHSSAKQSSSSQIFRLNTSRGKRKEGRRRKNDFFQVVAAAARTCEVPGKMEMPECRPVDAVSLHISWLAPDVSNPPVKVTSEALAECS